jgi:hypothetical protein
LLPASFDALKAGPGGVKVGATSNFERLALRLALPLELAAVVAELPAVVDELAGAELELPQAAAKRTTEMSGAAVNTLPLTIFRPAVAPAIGDDFVTPMLFPSPFETPRLRRQKFISSPNVGDSNILSIPGIELMSLPSSRDRESPSVR